MKGPTFRKNLFECIPPEGSEKHFQLLEFCKHNHSHVLATMPFIASEVAEFCGFYAFFELIREFGGSKINLAGGPGKLLERYGLFLSEKSYEKLMFHTECDWIDLPSAWGVFIALRRAAIMGEVKKARVPTVKGPVLNRTLAQKYGVSERYIRKLTKIQPQGTPPQPPSKAGGTMPRD